MAPPGGRQIFENGSEGPKTTGSRPDARTIWRRKIRKHKIFDAVSHGPALATGVPPRRGGGFRPSDFERGPRDPQHALQCCAAPLGAPVIRRGANNKQQKRPHTRTRKKKRQTPRFLQNIFFIYFFARTPHPSYPAWHWVGLGRNLAFFSCEA